MEIACDESGYEGEKLIGTTTDVFAHASVRLDSDAAAECIQELRRRIRSPATHYKANHILREKHRKVLVWMLGESSPAFGNVHVFLIEKEFYVLSKIAAALLVADAPNRTEILYRHGRQSYGSAAWHVFLLSCNEFMRGKQEADPFLSAARELGQLAAPPDLAETMNLLAHAIPPTQMPSIDPLLPAITQAVGYWGRVSVAHDRQNMLRSERVSQLTGQLNGQLTSFRLVNSFTDFRVQVADVMAGAARKLVTDELHGHADEELTALLRPYLDAQSIWGDEQSWKRLTSEP